MSTIFSSGMGKLLSSSAEDLSPNPRRKAARARRGFAGLGIAANGPKPPGGRPVAKRRGNFEGRREGMNQYLYAALVEVGCDPEKAKRAAATVTITDEILQHTIANLRWARRIMGMQIAVLALMLVQVGFSLWRVWP
jgi:hypothetical protein